MDMSLFSELELHGQVQVDIWDAIAETERETAATAAAELPGDGALFALRVTDEPADGALFGVAI